MLGGFLYICICTCTIYCGLWPPDNTSCIFLTWYQSIGFFFSLPHAQLVLNFRSSLFRPDRRRPSPIRRWSSPIRRRPSPIGIPVGLLALARSAASPDRPLAHAACARSCPIGRLPRSTACARRLLLFPAQSGSSGIGRSPLPSWAWPATARQSRPRWVS
jgi:hypothetical protein